MDPRSRDRTAALVAAARAVLAGAATYAATGTVLVLLSPGLEVESPAGLLVGPVLVFAAGLFWGLVGGALFGFAPILLVFLRRPRNTLASVVAISVVLFAPLYWLGFRGRVVDGVFLALSIGIGVWTGLARLAREASEP